VHCAVSVTLSASPPAQRSVHEDAPRQSRLHVSVQVTSQSAPSTQLTFELAPTVTLHTAPVQLTLLLAPTSSTQLEPGAHVVLHDSPQVPSHVAFCAHVRLPLFVTANAQPPPSTHAQLLPLAQMHSSLGHGATPPSQPTTKSAITTHIVRRIR
jgi:hypothetical protein